MQVQEETPSRIAREVIFQMASPSDIVGEMAVRSLRPSVSWGFAKKGRWLDAFFAFLMKGLFAVGYCFDEEGEAEEEEEEEEEDEEQFAEEAHGIENVEVIENWNSKEWENIFVKPS